MATRIQDGNLMVVVRWASGLACACGVAVLTLATTAPERSLAVIATLGSGLSALLATKPKSAAPSRPVVSPPVTITPLGEAYESSWQIDGQDKENRGMAVVMDFGDRIAVRQTEVQQGAYVMELKRQSPQTVTGIWWYFPTSVAQGTFQGKVSEDGKEIIGRWNGPKGQGSGDWVLKHHLPPTT